MLRFSVQRGTRREQEHMEAIEEQEQEQGQGQGQIQGCVLVVEVGLLEYSAEFV